MKKISVFFSAIIIVLFLIFLIPEAYACNPEANAGPDQTVCNEVTLDGSESIDDGEAIVSFEWELEHQGNSAYNKTAIDAESTVTGLEFGVYIVTLTVTDSGGHTGTDTMVLTVDENECEKMPPVADAGEFQVVETNKGEDLELDGSDSYDSDGTIESYEWTLKPWWPLDDLGITVTSADPQIPVSGLEIDMLYNVTLTVTDNDGLADTDTVTIKSCFISSVFDKQLL